MNSSGAASILHISNRSFFGPYGLNRGDGLTKGFFLGGGIKEKLPQAVPPPTLRNTCTDPKSSDVQTSTPPEIITSLLGNRTRRYMKTT